MIPVTSSADESCTENRHRTIKVKQGYLAGNFPGIPAGNNPGIPTISDQPCILVFNVPAGQKLNMTLFDFTQRMTPSVSLFDASAGSHQFAHEHQGQMCRQYAVVREPATGFSVSICGGSHREKHAYLSRSNLVHLQMSSWNHVTTDDAFQPIRYMIKFEGEEAVILRFRKAFSCFVSHIYLFFSFPRCMTQGSNLRGGGGLGGLNPPTSTFIYLDLI